VPPVVRRSRREAGKSPLLTGCWHSFRGPLDHDLRAVGISLWQLVHYDEVELLVSEALAAPDSRLARAVASEPVPVAPEQTQAADETMADYRRMYNL